MKLSFQSCLVVALLCLGLAGCSQRIPDELPVVNTSDWANSQARLRQLNHWYIEGRISVQTSEQGGQADLSWQQFDEQRYQIRLQAPLGAGTTWIEGGPQGVELRTSAGDVVFDQSVDALLLQLQGWPLPVSGLFYWIRGLPAETAGYKIRKRHTSGYPRVIEQDGWRIELLRYQQVDDYVLPSKLFIRRLDAQEVDVRLIIRQWQMQPVTEVMGGVNG